MRISDWSSDVCSSDLILEASDVLGCHPSNEEADVAEVTIDRFLAKWPPPFGRIGPQREQEQFGGVPERRPPIVPEPAPVRHFEAPRSEEHTSELQSLMRISYAVFCLKKKNTNNNNTIVLKPQRTTNIT